jgi:hypothetical protein
VSDGFPSHSYAGAIPSRDGVDEDEARFLRVFLVFCRGHKTVEVQSRLLRGPRAAWTMRKVGQSMVGL